VLQRKTWRTTTNTIITSDCRHGSANTRKSMMFAGTPTHRQPVPTFRASPMIAKTTATRIKRQLVNR